MWSRNSTPEYKSGEKKKKELAGTGKKKKKKELAGTGIETPFFGSSNQLHVYPLIDSIKTSRYKQSIINVLI